MVHKEEVLTKQFSGCDVMQHEMEATVILRGKLDPLNYYFKAAKIEKGGAKGGVLNSYKETDALLKLC